MLYILSGASACGKTTLLNSVLSEGIAKKAPKFAERPSRGADDDIISVQNIEEVNCDLLYVINERRYGINTELIANSLESESAMFVILSDLRIVRRLKQQFADKVRTIYISSNIDEDKLQRIHLERHPFCPSDRQREVLSYQFSRLESAARLGAWDRVVEAMMNLLSEWNDLIPEGGSARVRAQKIRLFHNRYIDNIALFDHVILNYRAPEEMTQQVKQLMHNDAHPRVPKKSPPVFFVCAASGTGKGTLMENLNIMGTEEIAIVSKQAKRDPKPTDRRDGMIAIGRYGSFGKAYDWQWTFHKEGDFEGVRYAVSRAEIEANLRLGKPQILISNMGQMERAREYFGENMVFVYLHSTRSEREMAEYQYAACDTKEEAEARLREIEGVHQEYIEKISLFDHVLLNTTFPEDLYDQMYRLLDYYRGRRLS